MPTKKDSFLINEADLGVGETKESVHFHRYYSSWWHFKTHLARENTKVEMELKGPGELSLLTKIYKNFKGCNKYRNISLDESRNVGH